MLVTLSIHKIALLDEVHLDFGAGLNVFTGETGAGKSILLDAIGLLLGNRGSVDLIREDADTALVEATFHMDSSLCRELSPVFEAWGLDEPAPDLVIARTLHRSGRTVCRINGRMANVQMLKDLGDFLVQQHGQHENLDLLRGEAQLALIDLFGDHDSILADVRVAYEQWREAKRQLDGERMDEQARNQRLDMLQFQIDEIAAAHVIPGEEEELRVMRNRLQNADRIVNSITAAQDWLDGSADSHGALSGLAQAAAALSGVQAFDPKVEEILQLLDTAQIHAQEASRSLAEFIDGQDMDPNALNHVEDRLAVLRTLERKYGPSLESVLDYLERIRAEHEALSTYEQTIAEQERVLQQAWQALSELAARLHEQRVDAASRFAQRVEQVLRRLGMPEATLSVEIRKRQSHDGMEQILSTGMDEAVFAFSANAGASPRPFAKIASGGELSRTMLAIKSVLADVDEMETLIFDEIDAGVSGAAAGQVAEQLAGLARQRQVLCVTHAPQIAAAAHHHFAIRKRTQGNSTATEVAELNEAGRVDEIARLVGADGADQTARTHAKALMDGFQERLSANG